MKITVETLGKGLNKIREHKKNNSNYEGVTEDYHNAYMHNAYSISKIKEVIENKYSVIHDKLTTEYSNGYSNPSSIKIPNDENIVNAVRFLKLATDNGLRLTSTLITEVYLQVTKNFIYGRLLNKEHKNYLFLKGVTPVSYGVNSRLTEIENYYDDNIDKMNPVELAVRVHNLYLKLFPIKVVGNGQTARLIMNYILINNDVKPFTVKESNLVNYEETVLEDLNFGTDNFFNFVMEEKVEEINKTLYLINFIEIKQTTDKVNSITETENFNAVIV